MSNQQQAPLLSIIGAGGHAKVVIDLIERDGRYRIRGVWDDNPHLWGKMLGNYKILGGAIGLDIRDALVIVAIGNNLIRSLVSSQLKQQGFSFVSVTHPAAVIARTVKIGLGTVAMAGVVVNADTVIGEHVILNTCASVDHDGVIGNSVHIAPGVHLCGTVTVGDRTLIGAGATVTPNIRIGANVIVAAGATVVRDVPDGVQVMGTLARIVKRRKTA